MSHNSPVSPQGPAAANCQAPDQAAYYTDVPSQEQLFELQDLDITNRVSIDSLQVPAQDHGLGEEFTQGLDQTGSESHDGSQTSDFEYDELDNRHSVDELQHIGQAEQASDTNTNINNSSDHRRHRGCPLIYRLWVWELLSSVFAIACIGSVVGILFFEQGKPLDQWRQRLGQKISPTAVVSFLGTLGKSACLMAVAEIISQLKWIHFRSGTRQLMDLQTFDTASRGPWGATQLIFLRNKSALLAVTASVVTIAALLMEPFIQLVFGFPSRLTPVPGVSSIIAATELYDPLNLDSRFLRCYGTAKILPVLQAAILSPLWNSTREPDLPCGFERCEWPTITTLGVCSSCDDLTETIVPSCVVGGETITYIECNYTLPGPGVTFSTMFSMTGQASTRMPYQPLWHSATQPLHDSFRPELSAAPNLAQISFIKFAPDLPWNGYLANSGPEPTLKTIPPVKRAMQCNLDICAQTFTKPHFTNFNLGPLTGPQTALRRGPTPIETYGHVLIDLESASTPPSGGPATNATKFQINYCDHSGLVEYLSELFTVDYSSLGASGFNVGSALSQAEDVPALFEAIARSMTEVFRTSPNSTTFNGVGLNTVTYISITWGWLALPVVVVVLAFAMLLIVILRNNTRGVPAWKSSSLALLFHELEGWDKESLRVTGPEDLKVLGKMTARIMDSDGELVFERGCN